jgi:hypothetical protein
MAMMRGISVHHQIEAQLLRYAASMALNNRKECRAASQALEQRYSSINVPVILSLKKSHKLQALQSRNAVIRAPIRAVA